MARTASKRATRSSSERACGRSASTALVAATRTCDRIVKYVKRLPTRAAGVVKKPGVAAVTGIWITSARTTTATTTARKTRAAGRSAESTGRRYAGPGAIRG